MRNALRKGFTLVEISIVLVVIGLIIGGVLVGYSMKRGSELTALMKDIEGYKSSLQLFQLKYDALPGDFTNAEAIWGSDAACPNTPSNLIPKMATCNGDGNRNIQNTLEVFRAPQQLANAGMIEGNYVGVAGAGGTDEVLVGVNSPETSISGVGMTILGAIPSTGWNPVLYFPDTKNLLMIVGPENLPGYNTALLLNPTEMQQIDQKMDDGLPGKGKVMSFKQPTRPNCITTNDADTAQYNITYRNLACTLLISGIQ